MLPHFAGRNGPHWCGSTVRGIHDAPFLDCRNYRQSNPQFGPQGLFRVVPGRREGLQLRAMHNLCMKLASKKYASFRNNHPRLWFFLLWQLALAKKIDD